MYRPSPHDPLTPLAPPLAPEAGARAPALTPLAAPMMPKNIQTPLVPLPPSAARARSQSGGVPLAPMAPQGRYNAGPNINAENAAKGDMDKYSNDAFNRWYATQDAGALAKFAPPANSVHGSMEITTAGAPAGPAPYRGAPLRDPNSPFGTYGNSSAGEGDQMNRARANMAHGLGANPITPEGISASRMASLNPAAQPSTSYGETAYSTAGPAENAAVMQQIQRENARKHFNSSVLTQDSGYQNLQAAFQMARSARMAMVPLAQYRQNDAQTGLVNAQADAVRDPQPSFSDQLKARALDETGEERKQRMALEEKKLASEESRATAANDTRRYVADKTTAAGLDRAALTQQGMSDRRDTAQEDKLVDAGVRDAQKDYDQSRAAYRDALHASQNEADPTKTPIVQAAFEKMQGALDKLSTARTGRGKAQPAATRPAAAPATQPAAPTPAGLPKGNGQKLVPGQHDDIAKAFLEAAKGDPNKARELAKQYGWEF